MADIMKLADDLGQELANHPATRQFIAVQKELSGDGEAQKLLNQYDEQARKMGQLEAQGKPIEPNDKHALTDLQTKLSANPMVKKFMGAQVQYADLLRKVNQRVMKQLGPAAQAATE